MTRVWGGLVSVVVLGAMATPLWHEKDDYPLSTYPMFSRARPPVVDIDHVVGIYEGGEQRVVPPSLVMRGEVLQTKIAISAAIGRRKADVLCREVAARAAGDPSLVRLEVRSDSYLVSGYFSSARRPIKSRVHARCRVGAP